ncbi:pre-mRNA-splicing factor 8 [Modicella reniformis]|uniref:Pre-mRNA-splicing factor 8 n=1 Tax=Modicella reniformis TaxID=1440133 RepID=A0A9P6IU10_9FUNG|nr:pre-mRNA-splicing factor 8 [Modicella reniformis]
MFRLDIQLRWGDFTFTTWSDTPVPRLWTIRGQHGHLPVLNSVIIGTDIAYSPYTTYGNWFSGFKILMQQVMARIMRANPTLSCMSFPSTSSKLYSSELTEPCMSSQNYGELFSNQNLWFFDDTSVCRVAIHKTFLGNLVGKMRTASAANWYL